MGPFLVGFSSHITNMLLKAAQNWPTFPNFSLRFAKSDRLLGCDGLLAVYAFFNRRPL